MRIYQYFIIGMIVGFISCSKTKFLDAVPNNSLGIPSSLSDFQAMLDNDALINGVGNNIGVLPSINEIGSDDIYMTDGNYVSQFDNPGQNEYIWNSNPYPGIGLPDWDRPYRCIYYANSALAGLAKIFITDANRNTWNNIDGSALFIRGFYFYQIAQVFAPPYDSSTAKAGLGIPLRMSSDVNEKISRATLQQTYDQILSDVKQSIPLLPVIPQYPSRPKKAAAYGLLARIYQTMEDYPNALLYADSSLQLNSTLMDYNAMDITAYRPFPQYNAEVLFDCDLIYNNNLGYLFVDSTLYNSYDSDDLRRALFFKNIIGGWSFAGSYDGGIPFGGLAVDEILLIRAECRARLGNSSGALDDLNTLLEKRWRSGTFHPYTTANTNNVLSLILAERRKEMVFRGTRWTDLRRLNRDPKYATTLIREVQGVIYTIPPNDLRYTWLIPDDVISFNPRISQNSR